MNRARIIVLALTAGTALTAAALAQSQPASSGEPPAGVDPATHAAHVSQGAGAHVPPAAQPVDNAELVKQLAELRAQIAQLQSALAKGQASGGAPQAAGGMQPAMPSGRVPMGPGMGMKRMGSGSMPPAGGGMSGMSGMASGGGGMPSGGGGGGMGMMDNMMGGMGGGSVGAPGMPGGGGGGGGGMMGMMDQMMSMGASRMGGGMSTGGMASALPGFPGVSHIYHLGATGFFIDHGSHITLTVEQQKQLGEIKEQSLLNQATLQRKIDQAEQELWDLTGSDAPDSSKIEAKAREIEQIKSEQRIEFIRDVGKAAAVLTDEQRKQLTGMAPPAPAPANQPAAMPGMGGGGGMSDM